MRMYTGVLRYLVVLLHLTLIQVADASNPTCVWEKNDPGVALAQRYAVTGCYGSRVNVTCPLSQRIIVLHEFHSERSNATAECVARLECCASRKVGVSLSQCNGQRECSVNARDSGIISSCGSRSDVLEVGYGCLPDHEMIDICNSVISNGSDVYLTSSDYPINTKERRVCKCIVKGAAIDVTALDLGFRHNGPNYLMPALHITRNAQSVYMMHVNDPSIINVKILNQSESFNISLQLSSRIKRVLEAKMWLHLTGIDRITCGYEPARTTPSTTAGLTRPMSVAGSTPTTVTGSTPTTAADQSTLATNDGGQVSAAELKTSVDLMVIFIVIGVVVSLLGLAILAYGAHRIYSRLAYLGYKEGTSIELLTSRST